MTAYFFPRQKILPTMYDLPSENPEEPGLPDEFHDLQPDLLSWTCRSPLYAEENCFIAKDLNLYYDPDHTQWYKRPDWFLVLGVPRSHNQQELRWSYVIWQELVSPFLVIELLSPGTEDEDLGRTTRSANSPPTKWEVYEQILKIPYYVVYARTQNQFLGFRLEQKGQLYRYRELDLSEGRLWIEELGLGLGIWQGSYKQVSGSWLRFYDADGNWIPTQGEQLEQERQEKDRVLAQTKQQLKDAITRLLARGMTVEETAEILGLPVEEVQPFDGSNDVN